MKKVSKKFLSRLFVPLKKRGECKQEMSILISLELEGLPPTVNHLYRSYRNRRYKTVAGRKYQKQVTEILSRKWKARLPCEEPLELRITFTTDNRRKWDIDNRVKALQDCLSMAKIIKDDRQVEILHVERKYGVKNATYIEVSSNDTTERISE